MRNAANSFGAKLKALRLEHGKSQQRLADELGISRSCLANYESGQREPDNYMLVRIADVFHVLVDFLIDRSGYRELNITIQELEDYVRMKQELNERCTTLDLSVLELNYKIALLQYYDYIETLNRHRHHMESTG